MVGMPLNLLDIHRTGARNTPNLISWLLFTWFGIFIDLPVSLLSNITIVRCGVLCSIKLFWRWARCLRAAHQQSTALATRLRDGARQQLPNLTHNEADRMIFKITVLATVAAWLGVFGR